MSASPLVDTSLSVSVHIFTAHGFCSVIFILRSQCSFDLLIAIVPSSFVMCLHTLHLCCICFHLNTYIPRCQREKCLPENIQGKNECCNYCKYKCIEQSFNCSAYIHSSISTISRTLLYSIT